ncbi:hypothetical protein [Nocardia sp. NPDC051570]|uniref:hypothetical protein n=1 Tax=Nocardia sp. NPDC051570 TaxID=3364324 RepID=UPI0037B5E98C
MTAYEAGSGEVKLGTATDYTIEQVLFSELRVGDQVVVMWGTPGVYLATITRHEGDFAIADDTNWHDLELRPACDGSLEWRFTRR